MKHTGFHTHPAMGASGASAAGSADRVLRDHVALFTKPAVPGRVKTRMTRGAGALSARDAVALHTAFLLDVRTQLAGGRFRLTVAWASDPGAALPPDSAIEQQVAAALTTDAAAAEHVGQGDGDLGDRLARVLAALDGDRVAAIGSDHPEINPDYVERGFAALGPDDAPRADVVLGPARDGGYALIALRRALLMQPGAAAALFHDVPWSTPAVLAITRQRCLDRGWRVALLPEADDVDTPADLAALRQRLAQGDPALCRHTRALLARLDAASPDGGSPDAPGPA
ncbi:MAG: TIGR04282 family arsenosugar biosynthesis glycosyltransferase [Acidobacteriota bacterium]